MQLPMQSRIKTIEKKVQGNFYNYNFLRTKQKVYIENNNLFSFDGY